jgi:hypothetical protein
VLIEVVAVVLTIAIAAVAMYVLIGVALLPVWAVGAVLRVGILRRVGGGWWLLPFLALEAGGDALQRFTAPRDGSRWKRPDPQPSAVEDLAESSDWARGLGVIVLWLLAIVGGFVLLIEGHDAIIEPLAGGAAVDPVIAALVLLTAAAAGAAWVLAQRYRYDSRPPVFRVALTIAILGGVFTFLVVSDRQSAHRVVYDYCAYGSVSQRQLGTCQSHVTANYVRSIGTVAAGFALSGSSDAECGAGAGPFCAQVINRRLLEDQAPPPGQ